MIDIFAPSRKNTMSQQSIVAESNFLAQNYHADISIGGTFNIGSSFLRASGGASKTFYDFNFACDQQVISVDFKLNDLTTIFRLYKEPFNVSFGALATFDANAGQLIHYSVYNGGETLPSSSYPDAITIPINTTDIYRFEFIREYIGVDKYLTIKLTNLNTKASQTYQRVPDGTGVFRDLTGIWFVQGSVDFYNFKLKSQYQSPSKLLFLGDSITDGWSLVNVGGDFDDRWCQKVGDDLGRMSCPISGRGGSTSQGLIDRMDYDLNAFNPEYTCVLIGTNDQDNYATWENNYDIIIQKILDANSIPILCTVPMKSSTNTTEFNPSYQQMNVYIKTLGYEVIDFAAALSIGNDGETPDDSLLIDGTHPTVAGHLLMYQQFVNDSSLYP